MTLDRFDVSAQALAGMVYAPLANPGATTRSPAWRRTCGRGRGGAGRAIAP